MRTEQNSSGKGQRCIQRMYQLVIRIFEIIYHRPFESCVVVFALNISFFHREQKIDIGNDSKKTILVLLGPVFQKEL